MRKPDPTRIIQKLGGALAFCIAAIQNPATAFPPPIAWSENFATDPLLAGRLNVAPGHSTSRFTYDGMGQVLTVHYDTQLPTALCWRPIDAGGAGICRTRDFQFSVTFRIRSAGFVADPDQFAQIGWGLVNSVSTGGNRAGNDPPGAPYAFNVATFDYFPNVSPTFGGPTIAGTAIHTDVEQSFFAAFEFPFGAESRIDTAFGDEAPALDTIYAATVRYSAITQTLTTTINQAGIPLLINADGSGGPGGPDGDPATIQTFFFADDPLCMDRFALTAWQDSFNLAGTSVRADVDIFQIDFFAPAWTKGDVNDDNAVNGRDIEPFVKTLTSPTPNPAQVERSDFTYDGFATVDDVPRFVETLLCP
ncbi:MAG: hypothetical protein HZA51_07340 [Planctomycetes bacterium]|nr:hypothetical protein [Planctomycetota bacterium]